MNNKNGVWLMYSYSDIRSEITKNRDDNLHGVWKSVNNAKALVSAKCGYNGVWSYNKSDIWDYSGYDMVTYRMYTIEFMEFQD